MTLRVPPALRALLAGSVDYAGMFPPAGLELEPALANHATYAHAGDSWLLGRFVLPTAKWRETMPLVAGRFDAKIPLRISALGLKSASAEEFLDDLRTSLRGLVSLRRVHGDLVAVEQFEAPLPQESAPVLEVLLWEAARLMETLPGAAVPAFWEVPFSAELPTLLRAFAGHNAQRSLASGMVRVPRCLTNGRPLHYSPAPRSFECPPFAVKLRTGGTEAAAFPTSGQLAMALVAARDAAVPLKFTAGLHHPLRHFDARLGTHMHGFLNVFAAGVLAREHALEAAEVEAILNDERPESFRFDADGFSWGERRMPIAAVAPHREFITSFGSCSFDEPRDDLRRLGFLA